MMIPFLWALFVFRVCLLRSLLVDPDVVKGVCP